MISRRRVKKITESFIPDDIVVNIVSRLPTTDVIRCRHVCKGWRNLTSTQEFFDLHMRLRQQQEGNFPLIMVEKGNSNEGFQHSLLEEWWDTSRTGSSFQKFQLTLSPEYRVQFSLDGLIVLKQTHPRGNRLFVLKKTHFRVNYIFLNPFNGENVKIMLLRKSKILGVFFHPSFKEYCTLWQVNTLPEQRWQLSSDQNLWRVEYKLLNLGLNPCWRNIKNESQLVSRKYEIERKKPLFVDNCIYWMVYGNSTSDFKIMEFDINSEELSLITVPVQDIIKRQGCIDIIKRLVNNGGVLSMVEIFPENQLLVACISTLTNRLLQKWTISRFCFNDDTCRPSPLRITEPIALADKQLVFFSDDGIFVCNLEVGTVRKFGRTLGDNIVNVFSHVMTLASLKGCKSEFCMGYKDEEKCDTQWFRAPRKQISGSECSGNQDQAGNGKGSTSNGKASENAVPQIRRKA